MTIDLSGIASCYDPECGVVFGVSSHVTQTEVKIELKDWQESAIATLREWLASSKDHPKTADLWAAVYIQCGSCLRGWQDWCEGNPIGDDLPGWIEAATRIVTEKRWI
jgi:hypothetical protein